MYITNRVTFIFCVVMALSVGLGCKYIKLPGGIGGSGGGINESSNPMDVIKGAFKNLQEVKFYEVNVTSVTAQGTITTNVYYNAPDRFWTKNSGTSGYDAEIIVIGNETWSRMNGGKWTKVSAGQAVSANDMKKFEAFAASISSAEYSGSESVNGKDCLKYKFKSSLNGDASGDLWVERATGMPLKALTKGNYGGADVTITSIYSFDKETKVEAPAA